MANDPNQPDNTDTPPAPKQAPDLKSMGWGGWNANNVFNSWDLNPLAQQYGGGADGVRDTLSAERDQFLQPLMSQYRQGMTQNGQRADTSDQGLFQDSKFQNYAQTGQLPQMANVPSPNTGTGTPPPTGGQTPEQSELVRQMMERQKQQETDSQQRGDALYNTLLDRSQQSLQFDGNDPIIRQQTDAYNANTERSRRNYLADVAESGGPLANLRGEQRVSAEHAGQANAGFKAQLMGQELQTRRAEIQDALNSRAQFMSADQQNALQKQLGILQNAIQQQGLNNDTLRTTLQNQQYYAGLGSQNDQFTAQMGFNTADRAAYYDMLRRGLLS